MEIRAWIWSVAIRRQLFDDISGASLTTLFLRLWLEEWEKMWWVMGVLTGISNFSLVILLTGRQHRFTFTCHHKLLCLTLWADDLAIFYLNVYFDSRLVNIVGLLNLFRLKWKQILSTLYNWKLIYWFQLFFRHLAFGDISVYWVLIRFKPSQCAIRLFVSGQ